MDNMIFEILVKQSSMNIQVLIVNVDWKAKVLNGGSIRKLSSNYRKLLSMLNHI